MATASLNNMTDEAVIKSFPCYQGPAVAGCVVDFLGVKTRTAYISGIAALGGSVKGYPIPDDGFHATALEWAGALRAVLGATEEMVVMELGAGWGPWLVGLYHAARRRGIQKVTLVGVEGSKQHVDYMLSHFADNGLDPKEHTLLHGIVGAADGTAEFPIVPDPAADWGSRAVYVNKTTLNWNLIRHSLRRVKAAVRSLVTQPKPLDNRTSGWEKVTCYSIPTLLEPFSRVDLIHVDIQGDEYTVVSSARQVLQEKVKWMVIGTHTRVIEDQLKQELTYHNWELVTEESCQFRQEGQNMHLSRDGCQVWRNRRFPLPAKYEDSMVERRCG